MEHAREVEHGLSTQIDEHSAMDFGPGANNEKNAIQSHDWTNEIYLQIFIHSGHHSLHHRELRALCWFGQRGVGGNEEYILGAKKILHVPGQSKTAQAANKDSCIRLSPPLQANIYSGTQRKNRKRESIEEMAIPDW